MNPRIQRNRRRLIASALTLMCVLLVSAVVQRSRLSGNTRRPALQTRARLAEPAAVFGEPRVTPLPPPATATVPAEQERDTGVDARDVRRFVERWRASLLRQDVNGQVACYAPVVERYFRQRNVPRSQVYRDKKRMMELWRDVRRYDVSDIQIESAGSNRVTATFRKDWDARSSSRRFSGSEKERLTLSRLEGKWQIVGEEELKVYRVSRR